MRNKHRRFQYRWIRRLAAALALLTALAALPVSGLTEVIEAESAEESFFENTEIEMKLPDASEANFSADSEDESNELSGDDAGQTETETQFAKEDAASETTDEAESAHDADGETVELTAPEDEETPAAGEPVDESAPETEQVQVPEPTAVEETPEPEPAVEDWVVTGFEPFEALDKSSFRLAQKPDFELVLESLPQTVAAILRGRSAEDPVILPLKWRCPDYGFGSYGTYIFIAAFEEGTVQIDEKTVSIEDIRLDEGLEMPKVSVAVVCVTEIDSPIKTEFMLPYKPATAQEALALLELPDTLNGLLSDSEEIQAFPVEWVCENYDDPNAVYLVFTAQFVGQVYEISDEIDMPAVTVMIESGLVSNAAGEKQTIVNFEDLGVPNPYPVWDKPAMEEDAIALMKLPDAIKAQLDGVEAYVELPITWSCASYTDTVDKDTSQLKTDFVFESALTDADNERYELAPEIKADPANDIEARPAVVMPTVTMTVFYSNVMEYVDNKATYSFAFDITGDKTLAITEWLSKPTDSTTTSVSVPTAYQGVTVTELGPGLFENCNLSSAILPMMLITIRDRAFANCGSLSTVYTQGGNAPKAGTFNLPTEITTIGESAFENCHELLTLNLPEALVTLGKNAFRNQETENTEDVGKLKAVTMQDCIETIGADAFAGNPSLKGISLTVGGHVLFKGNTDGGAVYQRLNADGTPYADVKLPLPVSDLWVQEEASLIMGASWSVPQEGSFGVETGGTIEIRENVVIENHGTMIIDGTIDNRGALFTCDPNAECDDEAGTTKGNPVVREHTMLEDGISCGHCVAKKVIPGIRPPETRQEEPEETEDEEKSDDDDDGSDETEKEEEEEEEEVALPAGSKYYDGSDSAEEYLDIEGDLVASNAEAVAKALNIDVGKLEELLYFSEAEDSSFSYDSAEAGSRKITIVGLEAYSEDDENYAFWCESTVVVDGAILPLPISSDDIECEFTEEEYNYTGAEIKPLVNLTFTDYNEKEVKLTAEKDYTLTYEDNKKEGTGKVVIHGKGNFGGTRREEFDIFDDGEYDTDSDEDFDDGIGVLYTEDRSYGVVLFGDDYLPREFDEYDEEYTADAAGIYLETGTKSNKPPRWISIEPYSMRDAEGNSIYIDEEENHERYETMHLRLTNAQISQLQKDGFIEVIYILGDARLHIPLGVLTSSILLADPNDPDAAPTAQAIDMYDFCIEQVDANRLSAREASAMEGLRAVFPMYRVDINAVKGDYPHPKLAVDADGEQIPVVPTLEPAEDDASLYNALVAPEASFIIDRLDYVADIGQALRITQGAAAQGEDPAPEGCLDQIFFTVKAIDDGAEKTEEQLVRAGVRSGGVIEVYATVEEAMQRNGYLSTYDGTMFSDAHKRIGSCVLRLSSRLNKQESADLGKAIAEALTDESPRKAATVFVQQKKPEVYPAMNLFGTPVQADNPGDAALVAVQQVGRAQMTILSEETLEDLPVDTQQMFVPGDENVPEEQKLAFNDPNYTTDADEQEFAALYPTESGLYAIVSATSADDEEDYEDEEDEEDYEKEDEEDSEEDEEDVEDEEEPEEEEIEEEIGDAPEGDGAEDEASDGAAELPPPGERRAYVHRDADGDMLWLIDLDNHIVEFYREDTGVYRVGDTTGTLAGGMTVQYRDSAALVDIRLKYPQLGRFAVCTSMGMSLMMEETDVQRVETVISGVRP